MLHGWELLLDVVYVVVTQVLITKLLNDVIFTRSFLYILLLFMHNMFLYIVSFSSPLFVLFVGYF